MANENFLMGWIRKIFEYVGFTGETPPPEQAPVALARYNQPIEPIPDGTERENSDASLFDPEKVKVEWEIFGKFVDNTIANISQTLERMPNEFPSAAESVDFLPPGLIPLYQHQVYGLRWLVWREKEYPSGGILADEMGLGKTIMLIALMLKTKREEGSNDSHTSLRCSCCCTPSSSNLVVCPLGCLNQWQEEIYTKGKGLTVYVFHGPKRTTSADILTAHDVVLTTYQTMTNEHPDINPLRNVLWRRIILDEAHTIKNPKTEIAMAAYNLEAESRWAVTGTPVHNNPGDFFSLIKFLRVVPLDNVKVWDYWIGTKQIRKRAGALQRLHTLGKVLLLRRTKQEVAEGIAFPPKTVEVVKIRLCMAEREIYDQLKQQGQKMIAGYTKGTNNLGYMHILALLTRLRQVAILPHLIRTNVEPEEEEWENGAFSVELSNEQDPLFQRMYQSSKFKRILEDLEELRNEKRPMDKVVVVSSWRSTLLILHDHLMSRGFQCAFITGKESAMERATSQQRFNSKNSTCQILLLSLNAGGVGLNLVGGNHVMFIEPHWNPQLELQAQDRVHRFGQTKAVTVKRYIVRDTVEERILEIQQHKVELAEGVLNSGKRKQDKSLNLSLLKRLLK